MEKVTIYLHRYVYDGLRQFGDLSKVVNGILDAGEAGLIDIYYKAPCPVPDFRASRYTIEITNGTYLKMRAKLGSNNSMISLRRILYWFIDNEIYIELGWNAIKYTTKEVVRAVKHLKNAKTEITQALQLLQNSDKLFIVESLCGRVEAAINEIE